MNLYDPDLLLRLNRATTFEAVGEGILHDLRNPLQAISMAARTVAEEPGDSKTVGRLAPVVLQASEKLERALDRLALAQARVNLTDAVPIAAQTVIASALSVYRAIRKRRAPQIASDIPTDIPAVYAVEPFLRHAVLNLLLNAGESLDEQLDGCIAVGGEQGGDRVVITVDDNGPGIPAADCERVFESFFTTKADSGHLGLGLPVARHLLRVWGGSLEIGPSSLGGVRAAMSLRAVVNPTLR